MSDTEGHSTGEGRGHGSLPPPYGIPGAYHLELRSSLDCWACAVLVTAQNLLVGVINATLLIAVFSVFLMPAAAMLFYGFLCHSKFLKAKGPYCVHLPNDASSTALLVVGFALLIPLLVLALAAYCRLARHLQLGACFVPYTKAVYRNLPAAQYYSLGCCALRSSNSDKVWV
uniref:Transmembrane protein 88 isoform X1 n=1 Tax=Geotrypetes seraphini TaxID=260995 RepID=A0A6P8Q1D0_GEOSA|nr:transmembrane protein 88 isoform X1 [Geotrypetes seraphini]